MKTNYHTHTARCFHACGSDEEYVIAAIEAGFDRLGFSDHTPYPYRNGYVSHVRMAMSELEGYFESILRLRERYKSDIEIFIGLEVEYFPALFDKLLDTLRSWPLDYMILGQHYFHDELGGYTGAVTDREKDIALYADHVIFGMRTGRFSYLAHPDLINFCGSKAVYEKYMLRICEEALSLDLPLEINMQGFCKRKWYPSAHFFRLAQQVGNKLIFGYDAHFPEMLKDTGMMNECLDTVGVRPDRLIDDLYLRPPLK